MIKILIIILLLAYTCPANAQSGTKKELRAILDTVYADDQNNRLKINDIEKEFGFQSEQMKQLWQEIKQKDSINLVKVKHIINQFGWPGIDLVGKKGAKTIFLVIQHADSLTQVTYLPLLRDAVSQKNANPQYLALLEDRVLIRQGQPQLYGSQVKRNEKGENEFYPIRDEIHVNERRASMGLEPIEKYAAYFNITYIVPKE